ncbi:bifunctional demethylmenaquinone methyltransferase/2-methoxy-6-polyprenyl-1,4-benzoquinol methylase UbiE [Propylenella binzhouense]|nr:bifunctional demethylmenaquinone methyltransferase/2-methoxy-6-polyprenyl-1,4-benzoquinol methylase UbiE [Propylenella binzhouense]
MMPEETTFGFRDVPLREKQGLVDEVFHTVARRYDLMNDLMSGGLHRIWKDATVAWLSPPRRGGPYRVLDLAGGTGDVATRIVERSDGHAEVTVADINGSMLAVGRERAEKRGLPIRFVEANAESLPFPDARFDACTIAFGIRNVPRIDVALKEIHRVLRHGGRFLCLEFSAASVPVLDRLYDNYSFRVIPLIGQIVAGDRESYQYLVESIRMFPNQEQFAARIRDAGFERVSYRNLSGGIAAIHSGWKL